MPPRVHASVPLSLLKAVQSLDANAEYGEAGAQLLTGGQLGSTDIVNQQVLRYTEARARGQRVWYGEATGLAAVAGSRPDAALLFETAGRIVAKEAFESISRQKLRVVRLAPRMIRRWLSFRETRTIMRRYFDGTLTRSSRYLILSLPVSATANSAPASLGCTYYASALMELLSLLAGDEIHVQHEECLQNGHGSCKWSASFAT